MAPTKTTRRRLRPLDQLRKKLAAAADEITHHESRGLQQSQEIHLWRGKSDDAERTLASLQNRPSAYHERSARHVPLTYWADADLLELLHTIEQHARGQRAEPSLRSGALRYARIGFPDPLYRQVCQEATERGLVERVRYAPGAEADRG